MKKITCKNCETVFTGIFCNNCGEKIVSENDFNINRIIAQAFSSLTNFDSKIYKSLKLLFFKPGELSLKYVDGIRIPYMKPFQLFIIANIIFFIFLSDIDIFRTPSKWYFKENFDGIKVMNKVRQIASERNITVEAVAYLYDTTSSNISKAFLFLLIPCIALMSFILYYSKKIAFGKHIIFATHYFSFMLLIFVFWAQFINLFNFEVNKWIFIGPILFIMFTYIVFSFNRFYNSSWLSALLKGFFAIILINFFIQLYRIGINSITFYFI